MYEVYPDDKGQWILYKMGGGDQLVIAFFSDRADAEFARRAFILRDTPVIRCPPKMSPEEELAMAEQIAEWQKTGATIGLPSSGDWKVERPDTPQGILGTYDSPVTFIKMFPDEPDAPTIVG